MGAGGACGGASAPSVFKELNGSPEDSVNLFFHFPKCFSWFSLSYGFPFALKITSDSVFTTQDGVHAFVGEKTFAEFYEAREGRDTVARFGRTSFDGAKHDAGAVFRRGPGIAAALVRAAPGAGIDFCIGAGFGSVHVRLRERRGGLLKICDDVARLDEHDFDAERIQFEPQGITKT